MKRILLGIVVAGLAVILPSCGEDSAPSTSSGGAGGGVGGISSTGGSLGSGGTSGEGGNSDSGGNSATGGTSSTGGQPGTGGGSAAGGAPATGGRSGSGGSLVGGSSGTQDAAATGGDGGGGSASGGSIGGVSGTGGNLSVDGGGSGGPSLGCGKNTVKPNRKTQQTISIGGTTRYYLLNVPTNADTNTPLPLVFALHGYDMNNVALVDLYDFTAESGSKAITVLPQGEGPAPGDVSHWGDQVLKSTWSGNTANYDFIKTLKADVESKYCVDTSREYITGFSMGGMFTNALACEHNDWFRGYAPVAGGGPNACANANAKPAMIIHQGTADTIAKPEAGEGTRDFWTKQNGCTTTTTTIYTGCQSYGGCVQPVLYCVGNWTHTVDRIARANIWKFFNSLP